MEAVRGLTLSTKCEDNQVVIYASGELDFSAVSTLAAAILSAAEATNTVCVLHCEEVTFIDSEAVKCILTLQRSLSIMGKKLQLRECSREVVRVLGLLELDDLQPNIIV